MTGEIYHPSNHFVFFTHPKYKKVILKWTFKNYSKLILDEEYKITSFHPLERCDWEIRFRKSRDKLFLKVENKLKIEVNSSATISIIDYEEDDLCHVLKREDTFKADELNITSDTYRTLNNQVKDMVKFCIQFKIVNFDDLVGIVDETDYIYWESESVTKLSEELKHYHLENHPNEVILKTKDGEIKTNRAILRARSPFFERMFENLMIEKENEIILVDDVSKDALRTVIDFLHFEGVELRNDLPHLMELYYAADKFEVVDLRNMCAKTMLCMLTEENASGVLLLAHRHYDSSFEKSCIHFIKRRVLRAVIRSESWKKLKSSFPSLAVEVLEHAIIKIKSEEEEAKKSPNYGVKLLDYELGRSPPRNSRPRYEETAFDRRLQWLREMLQNNARS